MASTLNSPQDPPPEHEQTDTLSADELLVGQDSTTTPYLSVVMPTLNEEAGIETCLSWIKAAIEELQVPTEILISDSSTDRTPEIAKEMGAIVVKPDGKGYGYAYRYAFERTRGQYIVMGDADTTYDFTQIPRLLDHLKETGADMVMGSRLDGEIKDGAMPTLHQYIGNPMLTQFLNAFYEAGVSDAHSGFRIFTREAYDRMDLETDGMEFASEMIMDAGAKELQIAEVPIIYHERKGEETLDSFRDGWRHVRFMLVNAPGYLFSVPGVLLALFGISVMTIAHTGVSVGEVTLGVNSMIAGSLFTILGVQVGSLGVFATVASDPIQMPGDMVSSWMTENATLERGATVGLVVFVAGAAYASWLIVDWILSGFGSVPFTTSALVAFTSIVIGVQIVFSSFFFSAVN
ncbi:glycosyltransferase family 2 protein [Halorubrum laminariae]|uniref:Glycosyltransferase family 2 protein n=1 Tax=Halorubrum laminariae TaxID=1433523 RepID=A0ABD6BZ82_9EURY|nr:glycosyltransferase family 2 protein [Halorubrum laminariae]